MRAMKLNSQADDIEEAQSKEHADLGATLTMFAVVSNYFECVRLTLTLTIVRAVLYNCRAAHWMLHARMYVLCLACFAALGVIFHSLLLGFGFAMFFQVGVVTIGQTASDLGIIHSVNPIGECAVKR